MYSYLKNIGHSSIVASLAELQDGQTRTEFSRGKFLGYGSGTTGNWWSKFYYNPTLEIENSRAVPLPVLVPLHDTQNITRHVGYCWPLLS